MKTNLRYLLIATAGISLGACAKHANEIPAQYVSPLQYRSYDCDQIEQEMMAVSRKVSDLAAQVDKTASNDTAQTTVGIILFWPTLFFLDGDTPQGQEYGRLKGEFEALEKAAMQRKCGIQVEEYRPKTPVRTEADRKSNLPPNHAKR